VLGFDLRFGTEKVVVSDERTHVYPAPEILILSQSHYRTRLRIKSLASASCRVASQRETLRPRLERMRQNHI